MVERESVDGRNRSRVRLWDPPKCCWMIIRVELAVK